ncbi:hypothetical protein GW17_00040314 [Ensete ventricosum]|nr:hypothetical protein GW17_00040314 [Ensete ventricosum]
MATAARCHVIRCPPVSSPLTGLRSSSPFSRLISPAACEAASPFPVDPWRPPLDVRALRSVPIVSSGLDASTHRFFTSPDLSLKERNGKGFFAHFTSMGTANVAELRTSGALDLL